MPLPLNNFSNLQTAVGLGLVEGVTNRNVFGFIVDTPTLQHGDVAGFTSNYAFPPDVGAVMQIVSSNPVDVGMQIAVVGLDENWDEKVHIVTLNGATPVALPGLWSRINYVFHAGLSDVEFAGNVDVRLAAVPNTVFARAFATSQESGQSAFSVARNRDYMVAGLIGTIAKSTGSAGSNVEIIFTLRPKGGVFRHPFTFGLQRDGQSSISFNNFFPERLSGPADIICQAQASDAGIKTAVRYSIIMFQKGVIN